MNVRRGPRDHKLVIGGESRIELLPPEVVQRAKLRSTRRTLIGVMVLSALVSAGLYSYSAFSAGHSALGLAQEQARTQELLVKQQAFSEVKQVEDELSTVLAAQEIGTSTEILWKDYLAEISATLPAGMTLKGFTVESSTPLQLLGAPVAPLQDERVATVVLTANSPLVPDVKQWLDAMTVVTGFVDATPGSVTLVEETMTYDSTITLHVSSAAYANRFTQIEEEDTE